jgi:hypothetical protein
MMVVMMMVMMMMVMVVVMMMVMMISAHSGIYPCHKAAFLPACPRETLQRQLFFSAL